MTKAALHKLPPGCYLIKWNDNGGTSVATMGQTVDGDRWIAPANWVKIGDPNMRWWEGVEKMALLATPYEALQRRT